MTPEQIARIDALYAEQVAIIRAEKAAEVVQMPPTLPLTEDEERELWQMHEDENRTLAYERDRDALESYN